MKIFSQSIAIFLLIFFTSCLTGKVVNSASVQPLSENNSAPSNSILYTLPKTILQVEVNIEKTAFKSGPFANYTEQYLNISNVITKDRVEYRIKSVRVIEKGIADKSRRYAVTATGDAVAQYISISDQGVLIGVNTPFYKTVIEPIKQNILVEEITTKSISFDSVPLREKHLKATSISMMAELVANSIYKYRKRQSKLLGFEYEHHPCDAPTLEMSITELKKQEISYTEMFTGKSLKQNLISTFEIIPDSINIEQRVLFYFSREKGITSEAVGDPIFYQYHGVLAEKVTVSSNKEITQGLYYCVPTKIDFNLTYLNKSILTQEFDIAQLGYVLSLPASLTSKPNVVIEINPTNGAIKRIGKTGE